MPGLDRLLDPATRDYQDDGLGGYVETTTLEPQIYHQLTGRLNQWAADPDAGCDLYLVPPKANDANIREREAAMQHALQPFIREGAADQLHTKVVRELLNRLGLEAELNDLQDATRDPLEDDAGGGYGPGQADPSPASLDLSTPEEV